MTPSGHSIFIAIFIAAMLTYGLRIGGLLISENLPNNSSFRRFMDALPGTILLSLVVPGIVSAGLWGWIATALTVVCAYKTGNILLSMAAGMAVMIVKFHLIR